MRQLYPFVYNIINKNRYSSRKTKKKWYIIVKALSLSIKIITRQYATRTAIELNELYSVKLRLFVAPVTFFASRRIAAAVAQWFTAQTPSSTVNQWSQLTTNVTASSMLLIPYPPPGIVMFPSQFSFYFITGFLQHLRRKNAVWIANQQLNLQKSPLDYIYNKYIEKQQTNSYK